MHLCSKPNICDYTAQYEIMLSYVLLEYCYYSNGRTDWDVNNVSLYISLSVSRYLVYCDKDMNYTDASCIPHVCSMSVTPDYKNLYETISLSAFIERCTSGIGRIRFALVHNNVSVSCVLHVLLLLFRPVYMNTYETILVSTFLECCTSGNERTECILNDKVDLSRALLYTNLFASTSYVRYVSCISCTIVILQNSACFGSCITDDTYYNDDKYKDKVYVYHMYKYNISKVYAKHIYMYKKGLK